MPKQEPVWRRRTPRSCPSTRRAGPPHFPRPFARFWKARSSAALFALLTAASACRSLRPDAPDTRVALRADLIRIDDTRRVELPPLDSALRASDPAIRRAAALSVGRVGVRERIAALRSLIMDHDVRVAGAALYALGRLKDSASVSAAATALRGAPEVATEAAWLLGELEEVGRPALLTALADPSMGARRGPVLLAL